MEMIWLIIMAMLKAFAGKKTDEQGTIVEGIKTLDLSTIFGLLGDSVDELPSTATSVAAVTAVDNLGGLEVIGGQTSQLNKDLRNLSLDKMLGIGLVGLLLFLALTSNSGTPMPKEVPDG
jgi:hypothetical protein